MNGTSFISSTSLKTQISSNKSQAKSIKKNPVYSSTNIICSMYLIINFGFEVGRSRIRSNGVGLGPTLVGSGFSSNIDLI